jgi:hypothetical protein
VWQTLKLPKNLPFTAKTPIFWQNGKDGGIAYRIIAII